MTAEEREDLNKTGGEWRGQPGREGGSELRSGGGGDHAAGGGGRGLGSETPIRLGGLIENEEDGGGGLIDIQLDSRFCSTLVPLI